MRDRQSFFEQVYDLVRGVPAGRVATYGQIASLLGLPHGARTVGWALRAGHAPADLPWHRVINSSGRISLRAGQGAELQRALLEDEGVTFGVDGRIDLTQFGWDGNVCMRF